MLAAARELLLEDGAAGLSWEGLAARSGINRSTIYRRWGTLSSVVGDLASLYAGELQYPNTGDLESDLSYAITQIAEFLTPENSRLVQTLMGWRDEAVETVMAAFWASRKQAIGSILARYGRTDDVAVLVRVMAGPLYYSALLENRQPFRDDIKAAIAVTNAWLRAESGTVK